MDNTKNKVIITVVGKDTVGIIAKVCTYLSEGSVNVLDISQTIVSGYFNMMMIVDMAKMEKPFVQAADELFHKHHRRHFTRGNAGEARHKIWRKWNRQVSVLCLRRERGKLKYM